MRAVATVVLMLVIGYALVLLTDWYWRRKEQQVLGPKCRCGTFHFTGARRYFLVRGMLHLERICAPEQEMIWDRSKGQPR